MSTRVDAISQAMSRQGFKVTAARRAILTALVECGGHITAAGLVDLVHKQNPTIGRMTVYRTLDLLSGLGSIRPVYQGTGAAHFILLDSGHHHHLVCTNCDQVIEFDECLLGQIEAAIGTRFAFQVQGHLLEFYGRCVDCRDENPV